MAALLALASLAACGDGYAPYVEVEVTTTTGGPQVTEAPSETTAGTGVRFTQVSAGANHTCAVDTEGGIWCWGGNRYGQLGDGELLDRARPKPATPPVGTDGTGVRFTQVSAGANHTCAVDTEGGVWCWGGNFVGKLGTGNTDSHREPVAVRGIGGAVWSVHAGTDRTCAVGVDTTLWCWGLNTSSQIWDRPTDSHLLPVRVADRGVTAYSMIGGRGCAVTVGGVACYGNNIKDFAEQGIVVGYQHSVEGAPGGLAQIAQTRLQTCGRSVDGELSCWGGFINPEGSEEHGRWQAPAVVPGLSVRLLAATESTMCMVTSDETVLCWGYRPPSSWMNPTEPPAPEPWTMAELATNGEFFARIVDISGGSEHFCAVGDDGTAACWGANTHGQLGDGTTTPRRNAVTVAVVAPTLD